MSENPLELVEPPAMSEPETETLTAAEIASVLKAYKVLEEAADADDKPWYAAARRMTTVALSTGLRRGELLGLRWQDVEMLDRLIHVRQQFVRNEITTPKSRAGRRALPLGDVAARRSRSSARPRGIARPSRSCSAIRRSARRSTRRS